MSMSHNTSPEGRIADNMVKPQVTPGVGSQRSNQTSSAYTLADIPELRRTGRLGEAMKDPAFAAAVSEKLNSQMTPGSGSFLSQKIESAK